MRSSLFSFPFAAAVTKLHSALVFFLPVTDMHPGKQIHRLNRDNSKRVRDFRIKLSRPVQGFQLFWLEIGSSWSYTWQFPAGEACSGAAESQEGDLARTEAWLAQHLPFCPASHVFQGIIYILEKENTAGVWLRWILQTSPQCEMNLNFVLMEALGLWAPWGAVAHIMHTQHWQTAEFGFFSISASQLKSQSALGILTHGCDLSSCRHLPLKGNEERLNLQCCCKYS